MLYKWIVKNSSGILYKVKEFVPLFILNKKLLMIFGDLDNVDTVLERGRVLGEMINAK